MEYLCISYDSHNIATTFSLNKINYFIFLMETQHAFLRYELNFKNRVAELKLHSRLKPALVSSLHISSHSDVNVKFSPLIPRLVPMPAGPKY
jgi:hypothetical protein